MSERIDNKYIEQSNQLENELFDLIDEGTPNQHRILKANKILNEFNIRHAEIWNNHEAELIAEGLLTIPVREPERDLIKEFETLKTELKIGGYIE